MKTAAALLASLALPSDVDPPPANQAFLECPGGDLGFGLALAPDGSRLRAWIVNGGERIEIPRVEFNGRDLVLGIDHYDAEIHARQVGSSPTGDGDGSVSMEGEWRKRTGTDSWSTLPFRLVDAAYPVAGGTGPGDRDVTGRWAVDFASEDTPALGVFEVDESGVATGTFLTTTGDYRYLAGRQVGDVLTLSVFDGAHAFLFEATLQDDGSLAGDFWSRDAWHDTWTARRDPDATMPDGFTLTRWVEGGSLSDLSFPDLTGTPRSLDDPAFAGKARILQVFGSWCPNCHDASEFMAQLDRRYRERGLSILGLAFEVADDFDRNVVQVQRYADRHGVTYPVLIAGSSSSKAAATATLTVLDEVRSYPTTIFLHGDGRVRAVYQGFSGPATGPAHDALVASFEAIIEELLSEDGARG